MASIKFIITDDQPEALAVTGSILDIVAHTTYLIGKIYHTLHTQNPAAGAAIQKMLMLAISDQNSPVWNVEPGEGEITICSQLPLKDTPDGPV